MVTAWKDILLLFFVKFFLMSVNGMPTLLRIDYYTNKIFTTLCPQWMGKSWFNHGIKGIYFSKYHRIISLSCANFQSFSISLSLSLSLSSSVFADWMPQLAITPSVIFFKYNTLSLSALWWFCCKKAFTTSVVIRVCTVSEYYLSFPSTLCQQIKCES